MKNLKTLKLNDMLTGLAVTVGFAAVAVPMAGFAGGFFAGLVGVLAMLGYRSKMNALQLRTNRQDGGQWSVEIDGITIGMIHDTDYAMICHGAYTDARLFAKQLLALGRPLFKSAEIILRIVPAITFWSVIAMLIVSPDTMQATVGELGKMTMGDAAYMLKKAGPTLLTIMVGVVYVSGAVRLENVFTTSIAYRIRQRLGVAAVGQMTLTRREVKEGKLHMSFDQIS